MVCIEIEKGKEFFEILKGLSNIFPSIMLAFDDEGMKCGMIDYSRTFMIKWNISKDKFSKYEIDGERKIVVDLDKLVKSKFKVNNKETLTIRTDDEKAMLIFRTENNEGRKREFRMREAVESDELSDMIFNRDINFEPQVFAIVPLEILKDAVDYKLDTDVLTIRANKDKLCFERIEDGNICSVNIELESGTQDLVSYDFKSDDEVMSMYRIELLKASLDVLDVSSFITIEFSKESPLVMSTDSSFGGSIRVIVAPTIV